MVPSLLLLLAAQLPAPERPPVRVWLGSGTSSASTGDQHVYVHTSADGHLVVLQARPDGRVEVLFPPHPTSDPFVRAGTYEIPGLAQTALAGRGMVVAALSPDPIWFDEFVQNSDWDTGSLTGDGAGGDPEGLLTDIVQRMLGDGSFNYDVVAYTVAPRAPLIADATGDVPQPADECVACSVSPVDIVVGADLPLRRFPHRHRSRAARPPVVSAAPAPTPAAIAVYSVHHPSALEPLPLDAPRPVAPGPQRRPMLEQVVAAARAVPLVARARPAAAQASVASRSQLLLRVVHARESSAPAVPANDVARATVTVVLPSSPAARASSNPLPVAGPEPRVVTRADTRSGAARAGTASAAPTAARAGAVTGVGLGAVHTAGWRH